MVIGVTGKYCSGKNAVGNILEKHGFLVIDVDLLGHEAIVTKKDEIVKEFGTDFLKNNQICRAKLGKKVFSDPKALIILEQILHPWMINRTKELVSKNKTGNTAINAAVLFKMGLENICDSVIFVKAPLLLRLKRAFIRDNLSIIQIIKRIWSQKTLSSQSSQNIVDIYIIGNKRNLFELEKEVLNIID